MANKNNNVPAQVDLTSVKPYGDTLNDGYMELAFTLPVPYGEEAEEAAKQYDAVLNEAKELMVRKNHDYGEAWREMSKEGIVDMILAKIIRIKTILEHDGKTIASEGVEGNYFDIINYAIFDLIHYTEN